MKIVSKAAISQILQVPVHQITQFTLILLKLQSLKKKNSLKLKINMLFTSISYFLILHNFKLHPLISSKKIILFALNLKNKSKKLKSLTTIISKKLTKSDSKALQGTLMSLIMTLNRA